MFGYLLYNPEKISKEDKDAYQECYCGLCNRLYDRYGLAGRKTLSYDLTFVTLFLTAVYDCPKTHGEERCPVHPLHKHPYWYNDATLFAADMNLVLSYYKMLDDYYDDNNKRALKAAKKIEPEVSEIRKRYPEQMQVIEKCLSDNMEMEKNNVTNPDLPSNCFGYLMAQIFTFRNDDLTPSLQKFGFYLGKFIYLMDAYMDLKDDLKKQRYNPLVSLDTTDFVSVLESVIADCTSEYEKLPVTSYKNILDNVLYSGVWSAYQIKQRKEKRHERSV